MDIKSKIDPLYSIFEQHLFNFQDPNADRKTFLDAIVKDYISQMRKMGLSVPSEWEEHIFEELFFQVNTMLVKKIYGCLTINEFIETKKTSKDKKVAATFNSQKKKAKARYQELTTTADQMASDTTQKVRKSA
jgi:DNA-binding transcriptional regulator YhcF (GntR family)